MPNVVIVRNTYPDNAALNNVIHYALNKAAFCGGFGITPEIGEKIGNLKGVSAKTAYSSVIRKD